MHPIAIIESNCLQLTEQRAKLRRKFETRQKAVLEVTQKYDDEIRALQTDCSFTRNSILQNLKLCREQFRKPKTREFAGIVVGFEKERDTVTMPEDAILVDRIEKLLPKVQAETVLDRSVTIIKTAFKKLPRELLQKLGCSFTSGADQPIVRPNDDDIESLVQKSLGETSPAAQSTDNQKTK